MQQPSRRSLLVSTAGALTLGTAGCLGQAAPADEPRNATSDRNDETSVPQGLQDALEYVYRPDGDGGIVVRITRHEPDASSERMGLHPTLTDVGDPSWVVYVSSQPSSTAQSGLVARGNFETPSDTDRYAPDGSRAGFDRFRLDRGEENDDRVLATDGETLLMGSPDWVASTLDHHEAGDETFVEETDGVRRLLSTLEFAGQTVVVDDDEIIREPFSEQDVDASALPALLAVDYRRTDEQVSYTIAGWYEEPPDSANVDALETFLSTQLSMESPTVEVHEESQVAIARGTRDYTPPEERPETAGVPRFHEYDASTGEVLLRFERGDQLPVDRYELEIDGEVYSGDWARGQDRIGGGDVIAIDADAIEPGDDISISYESPDGSYSSGTGSTALRRLPFVVDYDPDAGTATITYEEGPPLPADRLAVAVGDGGPVERPWTGEVTEGDAVTVGDLPLDAHLEIRYERTDGETVRVGGAGLTPPGEFAFDYDGEAETLRITYPDRDGDSRSGRPGGHRPRPEQEPLPADRYEIRVDGEPASTQWADRTTQIAPGDSLRIEGVPVGTTVAVTWVSESGERHEVDGTFTRPSVDLAFSYDAESDELTVRHAGGQSVDPSHLAVRFHHPEDRTVEFTVDGSFSAGTEFVVEDVPEDAFGVVEYDEHYIERVHVQEVVAEG